jgi:hypothetical protein
MSDDQGEVLAWWGLSLSLAGSLMGCGGPAASGWGTSDRDADAPEAALGSTQDSGAPSRGDDGAVTRDDAAAAGSSDAGSGDADAGCVYPAGPYGQNVGDVMDPTLAWEGYAPGSSASSTFRMSDFYDCDKSKGINAIAIDISILGCPPCEQEAAGLEQQMESVWKPQGVAMLNLLSTFEPTTLSDANQWASMYGLDDVYVGVDPLQLDDSGYPTNVVVDPRTMRVVAIDPGFLGTYDPAVSQLATSNQ